jgi:hypothetical protein
MRPVLQAIADRQGGLFSPKQALDAGYTLREVKAHTRLGGPWVSVRTGVYAARSMTDPLDAEQRRLLADRAALLTTERPAVLSHDSAARVLKIPTLDVDVPRSHLTLRGQGGGRTSGGVTRHRDLLPLCVERRGDLVATSYARTALDIGRLHGFRHGVVAVDAVRQLGVPLSDLEAELDRMRNHPFIARAQAAVAASDAGAESVLETLGRELVVELGIGDVETQFAVRIEGGRIVWCDIRVGCHLFECEGFVKVVGVDRGGVATEPPAKVLFKQRKRQTAVCSEGLGLSPIYWSDLFGQARERAKERLRREYAVTEQRFGRVLPPHLREFADRHPRRRRRQLWLPDDLDAA